MYIIKVLAKKHIKYNFNSILYGPCTILAKSLDCINDNNNNKSKKMTIFHEILKIIFEFSWKNKQKIFLQPTLY